MGFFGKIKKGIKGIGKFARKAAPLAAFIPGVGPLAAIGIGAAGGLIGGEGWRGALKGAAGGAAGGFLKSKIPGVGNVSQGGGAPGNGGGFFDWLGGAAGGIGDYLKDNPSLVMGGISALGNARDATRT